MGVVPKTRFACLKMRHILNTHMVQYEERDLYRSSGLQTELKDRLESDYVQVPQLFIDGQHIGVSTLLSHHMYILVYYTHYREVD